MFTDFNQFTIQLIPHAIKILLYFVLTVYLRVFENATISFQLHLLYAAVFFKSIIYRSVAVLVFIILERCSGSEILIQTAFERQAEVKNFDMVVGLDDYIGRVDVAINDPWAQPSQKVPATAQQIQPPHVPELIPSKDRSAAAGQTPYSAVFFPPVSRPHSMTSQQLRLRFGELHLSGSLFMVLSLALIGSRWLGHLIPTNVHDSFLYTERGI